MIGSVIEYFDAESEWMKAWRFNAERRRGDAHWRGDAYRRGDAHTHRR